MKRSDIDRLSTRLPGRVSFPGDDAYGKATSPKNAVASQRPGFVVSARTAADVGVAVAFAAESGVSLLVQATGHGAGRSIDEDTFLLDTSQLRSIEIDADRRVVRCGPGATFGAINAEAFKHGLLAPSGTAHDVAPVGYASYGGIGWLTRPHGLASAALLSIDVVDGVGRRLRSDDDQNADVLWAYRGGGGVGVATSLEMHLFAADELWAGYALWPLALAETILPSWGSALAGLDPALSSALGILRAPDAPLVPADLRGKRVVHLSAATVGGASAARSLESLLAGWPSPAIQTFGPCDAARLATIHLDPPAAIPAWGDGRWLKAEAAQHVLEILTAAGDGQDAPLGEVELRHVDAPASNVAGAMTSCPGAFVLHAVGEGGDAGTRRTTQAALDAVLAAAAPFDTGLSAGAFRDGRDEALDDLPPDVRTRVEKIRGVFDPTKTVIPSRRLV